MERACDTIPKRLKQTETKTFGPATRLSTLLNSVLFNFLTAREVKKLSRAAQKSLETLADSPRYNGSLSMRF